MIFLKLHKDGTIEGTPREIALYTKLTEVKKESFKVIPPTIPSNPFSPGGSGTIYNGTVSPSVKYENYHTVDDYVRGLFAAIGSKDNLH